MVIKELRSNLILSFISLSIALIAGMLIFNKVLPAVGLVIVFVSVQYYLAHLLAQMELTNQQLFNQRNEILKAIQQMYTLLDRKLTK